MLFPDIFSNNIVFSINWVEKSRIGNPCAVLRADITIEVWTQRVF